MKDKVIFPDPLAPWKEKISKPYGLSMANAISKEWFNGGMITDECDYYTRKEYIRNKRLIVRGEQAVDRYKNIVSRQEGDLTYLNLDWRMINIPEKFVNIVANGIKDEYYTLDIRANDKLSLIERKKKEDAHRRNMRALPLMKEAKERLGLDMIPKGFIPEDEDELQLYSEMKDRPKIEMSEEITIDYIKKTSKWHNIENTKNKDLVTCGICSARVWTDPTQGIKVESVDPEYLVHSFVKENDFSDAYYFGYIDSITIHDIQRESDLKETDIRKIAKKYGLSSNMGIDDWESTPINNLHSIRCHVMRFSYKTNKTLTYKKYKRKGKTVRVVKKDEDFKPAERSDYGVLVGSKGTWLEGTYIVGTEYIYNYKESENIVHDELDNPLPPFIVRATDIYNNTLHSFLDNIEPIADQLQYAHLKIQHLMAELKPDLQEIDIDSLAELSTTLPGGKKQETWEAALNIMNVKGVIFTKRTDMGEMGIKEGSSVRPINVRQGTGLEVLLNVWAHYYNLIRDTTGINMARDGSLPHDALLGVNEMAQMASNTATQHIVEASIDFHKTVCETISSRIHSIFRSKNAAHLRKIYERAVGRQNIEALEPMKDRHLHDFGFTVEMVPTRQQMQDFKEDLLISLQDGSIDVEIKAQAQDLAKVNMKMAKQYLNYMRKKRRKEQMQEREHEAQVKSQNDIAAAQAAAQSQTQAYAMQKKIDLEFEGKMAEIRVNEKQAIIQIEDPEHQKEFQRDVFLKKLEVAKDFSMKGFLEDRKDKRVDIQAGNQSKLLEQRNTENAKAIDFSKDKFSDLFNSVNF